MTRALITGVTGQDGGYLAERLIADGVEVHGLAADDGWVPDGVHLQTADLRSSDDVDRVVSQVRPDLVFHLAGLSSVARSWDAAELTMDINFLGLVRVVEAVRTHAPQARIVHASSSEIFTEDVTFQDEATPIRPRNPYGLSKAVAHEAVQFYRDLGVSISSVILFNHESRRRPETFVTRKITKGVAKIARGSAEPLTLGNLEARGDWGHALDVVRALELVARHDRADDFVIATGESRSVGDFVAAAFAHVGIEDWRAHVQVDQDLLRPTDAPDRRGDAGKAQRELGWTPEIPFEAMVAEMVDADLALLDQRD